VTLLQAWARPPPYTATSYQRWRVEVAASAPNRTTLARFFGTWRDALEAAGLPTGGSRGRETNARAVETGAAKRVATGSRRRTAVLREVHNCWRLRNAPDSPGQAEIYRLFPGGWPAVLEALPPGRVGFRPALPLGQALPLPDLPAATARAPMSCSSVVRAPVSGSRA
jgi:hypothetical protein